MGSLVVLLLAERARSEGARPMRAVKGSLATPLKEGVENRKGLVQRAQSRLNQATLEKQARMDQAGEGRLDGVCAHLVQACSRRR